VWTLKSSRIQATNFFTESEEMDKALCVFEKVTFKFKNYEKTGVLGSPVTLLFSPSFQRPNSLKTSTRSKRFKTLRFFADLLDLP
jgi:hypothetical protein